MNLQEMLKNIIRYILFPVAAITDGEFHAEEGTLKLKFLMWLYGEDSTEQI